jgi:hypothetical protein
MKAIVATRFGQPADVLELKTLPDPTPPGPGEVVVRVTKRQLHPGNLSMIRGRFNIPLPSGGLVPGGDGVGIVGPPLSPSRTAGHARGGCTREEGEMREMTGGCLCGQVRYSANTDPAFVHSSGSAIASTVRSRRERLSRSSSEFRNRRCLFKDSSIDSTAQRLQRPRYECRE